MGLLDGNDYGGGGGSLPQIDPRLLMLASLAGAAGQSAMPSRVPVPTGAVLGNMAGAIGNGYGQGITLADARTKAMLDQLTLGGYQKMQALNGGGAATAPAAIDGAMPSPGASGAPAGGVATSLNPSAPYGSPGSSFTADPNEPGAELRDLNKAADGTSGLLGRPAAGAGGGPVAAAPSAGLLGGGGPAPAGGLLGPTAGGPARGAAPGGAGNQPPPLFNVASLRQQYQIAASTPGMGPQAAALLSLIERGVPEGAYVAEDGSIQARPGYGQYLAGKSYADAYGRGAGDLQFAGPIESAKQWAGVAPHLAEKRGEPFSLSRPGEIRYDGAGHIVAQTPVLMNGVDSAGAPFSEYRFPPSSPTQGAPSGGGAPTGSGPGLVSGSINPYGPGGSSYTGMGAGGAGAGGGPDGGLGAVPGTRVQTALSPMAHASATERGAELEKYGAGLTANATAAQQQQFTIDQMRRESGSGAGWTPGLFAEHFGDLQAMLNGAGLHHYDESLANFQAFQKNAMTLTTQATRAVSPRAAVQEMQMIREALPGAKTSNGGLGYMFDQFGANNDFTVAKAQAADAWRPTHGGTLDGFESDWNKNVSPFAFLVNRMDPAELQTMATNLSATSAGRSLLGRINQELSFAQRNGLLRN